ncbi:MAG: methyltransferase domain-containing protein [Candidatus Rokuibacteriota bacterium]
MDKTAVAVESHYARGEVLASILGALRASGKDVARLSPVDLAAVDEFHIRGREATLELAARGSIKPGQRVLDVGSGLGGSARYLAAEHGCRVTGIDLTQEYVDAANALARMVGLDAGVEYRRASALDIPEAAGSFDVVWTEHVQMNIAEKRRFYGEVARVLAPGGRLLFHDIFRGHGELHYPVPWADLSSLSFLATPDEVREILQAVGLQVVDWEDTSRRSLEWFTAAVERMKASGPPPLGIHLLMGDTARAKFDNMVRNLREGRMVVAQAVAEKPA